MDRYTHIVLRYHLTPAPTGLTATGHQYRLAITYTTDGTWTAAIHPTTSDTNTPVWQAASPDLIRLATDASTRLRTLDTDGLW